MAIEIKGKIYRTPLEQIEKNKQDITAITKDKTVTIYTHILTSDVDPNVHSQFSGTITLIGSVVVAVNGVVIEENTTTYPVVAFDQVDINKNIMITGYNNHRVKIDMQDFDDMNEYKLY